MTLHRVIGRQLTSKRVNKKTAHGKKGPGPGRIEGERRKKRENV